MPALDIQRLRAEAIRIGAIDLAAAQLLNAAGDEIQQLRVQRDALLQASAAPTTAEAA